MDRMRRATYLAGRVLLGLYFIVPGLMKVLNFDGTAEYIAAHGMVFIPFFLVLTIVLQLGGGACLVLGYRQREVSFVLAGLVLVISVVMHDFWSMEQGKLKSREVFSPFHGPGQAVLLHMRTTLHSFLLRHC